jgi:alpha-amylase
MRTRLKALSLCLAVLIAFAALPVTAAAVAQRSVQLDAQRVEIDLAVGTTHKLTGAVLPEGASQKMTWRSSNKNVATVSSAGLITARAVGRATVSARPATRGTWTRATVVVTDSLSPPASR